MLGNINIHVVICEFTLLNNVVFNPFRYELSGNRSNYNDPTIKHLNVIVPLVVVEQ